MYRIVADSGCDVFELKGASFATVSLTISTDKDTFVDDESLDTSAMISHMLDYKGRSYTACPSIEAWTSAFDMEDGSAPDELYIVTLTSTLSGTYNSANLAKDMYLEQHPGTKALVLDSLSVGPEMLVLLEKLVDLKNSGCSFEETSKKMKDYCKSTRLMFCFKSLHNLAQNGRINKIVAAAAGVLGIGVIGTANAAGEIESLSKARGDNRVVSGLLNSMLEAGYKGGKVRISNTENESIAIKMRDAIRKLYPNVDITYYPTRGLCSYYCERGGICVGFETV